MTQEDKKLLLIDLSARLPYGVKIELMPATRGKCVTLTPIILQDYFISDNVNYLPYLRPMSSMTEEEKKELFQLMGGGTDIKRIDFYISHHFDYRGLIEKDFALEAPKDMYKNY